MKANRKWVPWQGTVDHHVTGPVNFKATIQPRTEAAHIGADHPKYMAVGTRTECVYFDLYDDNGDELPHPALTAYDEEIRELIRLDYLRRHDVEDEQLAEVADVLVEAGIVA